MAHQKIKIDFGEKFYVAVDGTTPDFIRPSTFNSYNKACYFAEKSPEHAIFIQRDNEWIEVSFHKRGYFIILNKYKVENERS